MENRTGFSTRLGAAFIDALISTLLGIAIAFLLGVSFGGITRSYRAYFIVFSMGLTTSFFLYSLIEAATGASPGKRMLEIEIRDESGNPATQTALIMRWALKNIAFIGRVITGLLGIPGIRALTSVAGTIVFFGCFFVLGESRQAFHDRFACTAVFSRNDRSRNPRV